METWCVYMMEYYMCVQLLNHAQLFVRLMSECMDCNPPGSSVLGISQARILEWVALPSSEESS